MTTLSISIDEKLLSRAQMIAESRGMSVEKYLDRLLHVVTDPPPTENEVGPLTRACMGMLPPMSDEEVDRVLEEARLEKYGYGLDIIGRVDK